eukprot:8125175-Pyramimonas_sp.AAC.1
MRPRGARIGSQRGPEDIQYGAKEPRRPPRRPRETLETASESARQAKSAPRKERCFLATASLGFE